MSPLYVQLPTCEIWASLSSSGPVILPIQSVTQCSQLYLLKQIPPALHPHPGPYRCKPTIRCPLDCWVVSLNPRTDLPTLYLPSTLQSMLSAHQEEILPGAHNQVLPPRLQQGDPCSPPAFPSCFPWFRSCLAEVSVPLHFQVSCSCVS